MDVNHTITWVEVCFLLPEATGRKSDLIGRRISKLLSVKDAHARRNCRDLNGEEPWGPACDCDCTKKNSKQASLETGDPFLDRLKVILNTIHKPATGTAVVITTDTVT